MNWKQGDQKYLDEKGVNIKIMDVTVWIRRLSIYARERLHITILDSECEKES